MTHIYKNRYKGTHDPELCREAIYDGRFGARQCTRKPAVFRCLKEGGEEFGFCKQHDPVEVKRREEERQARWKRESEARDAKYRRSEQIAKARDACHAAIKEIAAGHNDPRTLAIETLKLFPEDY